LNFCHRETQNYVPPVKELGRRDKVFSGTMICGYWKDELIKLRENMIGRHSTH
jgi:hypothetical protein